MKKKEPKNIKNIYNNITYDIRRKEEIKDPKKIIENNESIKILKIMTKIRKKKIIMNVITNIKMIIA